MEISVFLISGPRFTKALLDEFNSSDEFNSFYTSQNRRILLHGRLWIKFVWIKFDDNATYEQGLSHRSLKGRETLHYLLKSPLPGEPCLACIRAAVLVEWHLRLFVAKMKTITKKHKRDVLSIAHQCLWQFVCEKWKYPVFGIRSWRRLSVDLRPRLLLPTSFISWNTRVHSTNLCIETNYPTETITRLRGKFIQYSSTARLIASSPSVKWELYGK